MNFLELAKKRYSVRSYLDKPVEEEKLRYVLEAGRIAPSAANFQPWHCIVARDKQLIAQIGSAYPRKWFTEAPVVLVLCGWKRNDGKDHTDIDIAIMADHMTLAAAESGLGTCWVCNFDADKISQLLKLPDNIEPIVLLPLGYPADVPDQTARHLVRNDFDAVVHWETF
jgi:nitroreductase